MPTYLYECQACEHRFEKFQSMVAGVLRKCPECGERKLQRLIGPGAAIIFKGSGFYETDYRSESYKKGKDADKEPVKAESSDSKSDTKKADTKKAGAEKTDD